MAYKYLYAVYDKDGYEIFRGNSKQISDKFDIKHEDVYRYAVRGTRLQYTYTFKRLNEMYEEEIEAKPVVKKKTKHEKDLEYLVTHLRIYKNTIYSKDPKPFIEELNNLGIDVVVRKVREDTPCNIFGIKKNKYFYVLEVKK